MKNPINYVILSGLVALLTLTSCETKQKSTQNPAVTKDDSAPANLSGKIVGTWRSVAPEQNNIGQFATREFRFSVNRWEMIYTLAMDAEMKKPIFIIRTEGSYSVDSPSIKLPGAFNAQFKFSKKYLNLKTKDRKLAKVFKLDECRLMIGVEADVTEKGCSFVPKMEECAQEFDILKLENGNLFLGERPQDNNICSANLRPESLGLPLKHIN